MTKRLLFLTLLLIQVFGSWAQLRFSSGEVSSTNGVESDPTYATDDVEFANLTPPGKNHHLYPTRFKSHNAGYDGSYGYFVPYEGMGEGIEELEKYIVSNCPDCWYRWGPGNVWTGFRFDMFQFSLLNRAKEFFDHGKVAYALKNTDSKCYKNCENRWKAKYEYTALSEGGFGEFKFINWKACGSTASSKGDPWFMMAIEPDPSWYGEISYEILEQPKKSSWGNCKNDGGQLKKYHGSHFRIASPTAKSVIGETKINGANVSTTTLRKVLSNIDVKFERNMNYKSTIDQVKFRVWDVSAQQYLEDYDQTVDVGSQSEVPYTKDLSNLSFGTEYEIRVFVVDKVNFNFPIWHDFPVEKWGFTAGGSKIITRNWLCQQQMPSSFSFIKEIEYGPWTQTIFFLPDCANDNEEPVISISGGTVTEHQGPDGMGYELEENTDYTFTFNKNASGTKIITNFESNYTVQIDLDKTNKEWDDNLDGTFDPSSTDGQYKLRFKKGVVGAYTITVEANSNLIGDECGQYSPKRIFVSGSDEILVENHKCAINLVDDFEKLLGDDVRSITDHQKKYTLTHFKYGLCSPKGVILDPKNSPIELTKGAQLVTDCSIEYNESEPLDLRDPNHNWVEATSFDQSGKILTSAKSFFDGNGRIRQSQIADFRSEQILVSGTINDLSERAALTTKLAVNTALSREPACDNDAANIHGDIAFQYNEDILFETSGKELYNGKHFDTHKVFDKAAFNSDNANPIIYDKYVIIDNDKSTAYGTDIGEKIADELKTHAGNLVDRDNSAVAVSSSVGAIGKYYAYDNDNRQAGTAYPYTLDKYHEDGTGRKKYSVAPGDVYRTASGYDHVGEVDYATDNVETIFGSYTDEVNWSTGDPLDDYIGLHNEIFPSASVPLLKTTLLASSYVMKSTDANDNVSYVLNTKEDISLISKHADGSISMNFYDMSDRLVVSIPPEGYRSFAGGYGYSSIEKSEFVYDSRGLLVEQREPDAGITKFMYRKDGLIRFSENQVQRSKNTFSYTNYDETGRPVESGEYVGSSYTFGSSALKGKLETTGLGGGIITKASERKDWIETYYDLGVEFLDISAYAQVWKDNPAAEDLLEDLVLTSYTSATATATNCITLKPDFEANAAAGEPFHAYIVPTEISEDYDVPDQGFTHGAVTYTRNEHSETYYAYDEYGRVSWFGVYYPGTDLGVKIVKYEYDYLGKVLKTDYQTIGDQDFLSHKFEYDENGRLKNALYGNNEGDEFALDRINYLTLASYDYFHDGSLKNVSMAGEGRDHLYTPEGYLKAVSWQPGIETLEDGEKKAFGYKLDYYDGDFVNTNMGIERATGYTANNYGGLISSSHSARKQVSETEPLVLQGAEYVYDSKNQLVKSKNPSDDAYKVDVAYDENGNITSLKRMNGSGESLDDFKYEYGSDDNRLLNVKQPDGSPVFEYEYNAIGQLTLRRDYTSESTVTRSFEYDVAGKLTKVKNSSNRTLYENIYDDKGFRVRKVDYVSGHQEVFVRDASGNILAVYNKDGDEDPKVKEMGLYGSSRVGVLKPVSQDDNSVKYNTEYFFKDHLGNTRVIKNRERYVMEFPDIRSFNKEGDVWKPVDQLSVKAGQKLVISLRMWRTKSSIHKRELAVKAINNSTTILDEKLTIRSSIGGRSMILYKSTSVEEDGVLSISLINNIKRDFKVDDLKVVLLEGDGSEDYQIVYSSDYYPFGLEQSTTQDGDNPRHTYQGDFAEKDGETGWNHFEARQYDPIIGRWTSVDPARQFFSPYVGMGNNPINGVDPDGEFMWLLYSEANIFAGIVKGVAVSYQAGTAWDEAGIVAYTIEIHGLTDAPGEVVFGADIGVDLGVGMDAKAKTFDEYAKRSALAVGLDVVDIKYDKGFFALEGGISAAFGFTRLTKPASVRYLGYTKADYKEATGNSWGTINSKKWWVRQDNDGLSYLSFMSKGKVINSSLEVINAGGDGWHTKRYDQNYGQVHSE